MPRRDLPQPQPGSGARLARRGLLVGTVAVSVIAVLSLAAGTTADAQAQEEGTVNVEAGHPLGSSIHYVVQVTSADGAPAEEATVTATVMDADGNEQAATPLSPFGATAADGVEDADATAQQGRYEGVVEFPEAGRWTVRFDANRPAGSAETTVEVLEAGATDLDAPDDAGGGGFAPADDAGDTSTSSGASGLPVLVIAIAALIAIGGLAAAVRIVRRYGPSVPPPTGGPSTPAEAAANPTDEPPTTDDAGPTVGTDDPDDRVPASDEANVGTLSDES